MPYTQEEAQQRSEYYDDYIDFLREKRRQEVLSSLGSYNSGSIVLQEFRDERGFLVSFENPFQDNESQEEITEYVNHPIEQFLFNNNFSQEIDSEFETF
tara:strand:+ start:358 stop:654 length:297 start_codon:yes stop_codon:yes gene_type:complete